MDSERQIRDSSQSGPPYYGKLQIIVTYKIGGGPIKNAIVHIYDEDNLIKQLTTDFSGKTPVIHLLAPPPELSMHPSTLLPYTVYSVQVFSPGLKIVRINGVQILPNVTAIQPVAMPPIDGKSNYEIINIEPHQLTYL